MAAMGAVPERAGEAVAAAAGGVVPRAALALISPFEPGRSIDAVRRELGLDRVVKLASNENPLGASPAACTAVAAAAQSLGRYPDPCGRLLVAALAEKHAVQAENVILGAGSAELMRVIASAYLEPQTEALMADLCFPMYASSTRLAGATPVSVPLDPDFDHDLERMLAAVTPATRVVFLASPNNPTGKEIRAAALERFLAALPPRVLCVLDLAYLEYGSPDAGRALMELWRRHSNVVILHTFSKVYGLAALRIGYALAHLDVSRWLERAQVPFCTSHIAQLAARASLADRDHVRRSVDLNRQALDWMATELGALGCRVVPSAANFLLVDVGIDSETVFQALLRRGIIVRPMRHPRLATWVRITSGTLEETQLLCARLAAVVTSEATRERRTCSAPSGPGVGTIRPRHDRRQARRSTSAPAARSSL
ncbi:MAG: histidinol-phosphate transaminase [Deltaproteobacteria bacterium]|nr:histidinol-phosphate transaminase [Deltaproteobacteria bacterium]